MCGVSAQYKEVPTPVEKIVHRDHHTIVNREVTREVVVEKFEPYEVWGSPGGEGQRGTWWPPRWVPPQGCWEGGSVRAMVSGGRGSWVGAEAHH